MLKKMCLTLCLTAFLAWAQDDEFDDSDFVSAGNSATATEASSESGSGSDDEFDDAEDSYVSRSKREDMAARKKFEEDQRADEYANSLRRRDWLKDRLMLEIGMGSRAPFMGETGMGMGFGAGVEYITRWHIGAYGSFGFLPKGTDNDFDDIELEGGTGYKVGLNYYLFPKNPLHLGLSVSYGTVYFDHDVKPDEDKIRPLIKVNGFQFDALITYLTNEWYYLQFSVGMYYAPELGKPKDENVSFTYDKINKEYVSKVVNQDGMSKTGIVFGIMIGYALPEFFPDDTEIRRREREKERDRASR
ncbi:MAG: hypothetical protein IJ896_01305 [Fibrobacter sp.]|nr:hypothetical protein [Fibrobacter sp.]